MRTWASVLDDWGTGRGCKKPCTKGFCPDVSVENGKRTKNDTKKRSKTSKHDKSRIKRQQHLG